MHTQVQSVPSDTGASPKPASGGWQNALILVLIVWLLVAQSYRAAINPDSPITGWDFRVLYDAAARLNQGQELYTVTGYAAGKTPYIYTPLVAEALRPVARLSLDQATRVCFAISAACLLLAIFFYAMAVPLTREDIVPACIMVLISFRYWPMVFNFGLGQINNALLMLACAMFWAERRGKSGLAGTLIALAALVKLWMFGILIYPIMRRNWKAVAWAIGFYVFALFVLFAPRGLAEWSRFVHVTAANSSQDFLVSQSIAGFVRLHFAANTHVHALIASPALYFGFMAFGYLTIGAVFFYLWTLRDPLSEIEARLWFGMALLSVPLVSPLCHDEYYILALPVLWTLLTLPKADAGSRSRICVTALAIYVLFTRPWPTSGAGLASHQTGLASLMASGYFILGAALWFVAVGSILRVRSRSAKERVAHEIPESLALSSLPANS